MGIGKMTEHDFAAKLAFSRGIAEQTHPDTIRSLLGDSCRDVVKVTNVAFDKSGVDFVATLRGGATLNIDIKARDKGCSKYWKSGPLWGSILPEPELSLETWSIIAENGNTPKTGWTLDESKVTDYTLHVFDHSDTMEVFFLPFQLLRMAFRANLKQWEKSCRVATQQSNDARRSWKSQCVFVPGWCVMDAITAEMRPKMKAV